MHAVYAIALVLAAVSYAISGFLLLFIERPVQKVGLAFQLAAVVLASIYCAVLLHEDIRREMVYRTHVGTPHPAAVYMVFHVPVIIVLFASCEGIWLSGITTKLRNNWAA